MSEIDHIQGCTSGFAIGVFFAIFISTLGGNKTSTEMVFKPSEIAVEKAFLRQKSMTKPSDRVDDDTLKIWARDVVLNEIENKLSEKTGHRPSRVNQTGNVADVAVIVSITDLAPVDVKELADVSVR